MIHEGEYFVMSDLKVKDVAFEVTSNKSFTYNFIHGAVFEKMNWVLGYQKTF